MKANKVFEEIRDVLHSWEAACTDYEITKERKREELGDGFWDWYKEHDKPECPISQGEWKAYHLWYWNEREELNFDDYVWESEAKDFIDTLRAAGVKTFTYTNKSTALMENMHWFQQNGCKLLGLCEVEPTDEWERKHGGPKMGVRFAL